MINSFNSNFLSHLQVEAIVGHRDYNGHLMYKIRWKNFKPIDDTWETHESLSCPDLLERYNIKVRTKSRLQKIQILLNFYNFLAQS